MSRTYKDAPWTIRAYRSERRRVRPDWRERYRWRNAPRYGTPEWHVWLNEEPQIAAPYDRYRIGESSAEDRTIAHRRYRARVRDLIAHEDYDAIEAPRATVGWFGWRW